MRRLFSAFALATLGLVLASPSVGAHALLASSQPSAGAFLEQAPTAVVLTFTEAPDPSLAVIHVLDSGGSAVEKGKTATVSGQRNTLTVALDTLSKGSYTVTWRTTSIVDGHTTGGSFAFGVGVKPSAVSSTVNTPRTPRPSALGVAGRWAMYIGLALLLGATVLRSLGHSPRRISVAGAWVIAALGATGLLADFTRVSSAGVGRLFHGGAAGKVGLELLGVAVAGVAVVAVVIRPRRATWALLALASAGALLARAWGGHAAASSVPWFTVGTQWVHLLAIGVWVGGLPWLIGALRAAPTDARGRMAAHFSTIAAIGLLVTVASGTARAVVEVGSWRGLFHTGFGQALLVKLALVALLIALGAVNRFRNVGRAARSPRPLTATVGAEIAMAAAVLAATALLAGLAPASSIAASRRSPAALTVTGHDFGTTTRVRLAASPGMVGLNHFVATITDYDSGRTITAKSLTLSFSLRDRTDVPASSVPFARAGQQWVADSAVLSIDGRWSIDAVVEKGGGGVSVPMTLRTKQPPVRITAQRSAGVPTLYTITQGNRQVQTYVDPGRSGFNEVHFTFLDPTGAEVPTDVVEARAQRAGAKSTALVFRRLDAGHFVADANLTRGTWRFSCRTADGFTASFTQKI